MMQPIFHVTGCVHEDSLMKKIFPDGRIPLKSTRKVVPDYPNAPTCYIVDANRLSEQQIEALARQITYSWADTFSDLTDAIAFVRKGLPLSTEGFALVEMHHNASS